MILYMILHSGVGPLYFLLFSYSMKIVYLAVLAACFNSIFILMTLLEDGWSIVLTTLLSTKLVECIKKKEGRSWRVTNSIIWSIIGMAIVTYIPRMLPLVLFRGTIFPHFLEGVLKNVPFAILGAFIFPYVLFIQ